ncbi:hypothetical protein ILYODFUR_019920 [Ilyodon furcidens]|uniref:Uncharacterized protein n=1 Tax=Ilyodon furcidens TaxID=33524 RepID=A0ABV0UTI1_9TELE
MDCHPILVLHDDRKSGNSYIRNIFSQIFLIIEMYNVLSCDKFTFKFTTLFSSGISMLPISLQPLTSLSLSSVSEAGTNWRPGIKVYRGYILSHTILKCQHSLEVAGVFTGCMEH